VLTFKTSSKCIWSNDKYRVRVKGKSVFAYQVYSSPIRFFAEDFSLTSSWFVRTCKVYWLWGEKWCHIYFDISLMIFTVHFEGGTTWDGKFIHISTVGLCWLYIKLFTHLWYVASSPVDSSVVTIRKSVMIMRWEVSYLFMTYHLWF
jgi:hypothetical protein